MLLAKTRSILKKWTLMCLIYSDCRCRAVTSYQNTAEEYLVCSALKSVLGSIRILRAQSQFGQLAL